MKYEERVRLRTTISDVIMEGADAKIEDIEYIVNLASSDRQAWHAVQRYCPELQLPPINHSSNAALTQLRSSLWPSKIQQSILSAGTTDDPAVYGIRSDSLDTLLSEDLIPHHTDAEIKDETNAETKDDTADDNKDDTAHDNKDDAPDDTKAATKDEDLPIRSEQQDTYEQDPQLPFPLPQSGQSADIPSASPSLSTPTEELGLTGLQRFRDMFGSGAGLKRKHAISKLSADANDEAEDPKLKKLKPLKRKTPNQKKTTTQKTTNQKNQKTLNQMEQVKQSVKSKPGQEAEEDDEDDADLEFNVHSLEQDETVMRNACTKALKLFSPFEKVADKPWLQKPPKPTSDDPPKDIDTRLRYLEGRFEAFDNFMLRHVLADDKTAAIRFDNSASYEDRVKALDEKNQSLERTLRKETVKMEKFQMKAKR